MTHIFVSFIFMSWMFESIVQLLNYKKFMISLNNYFIYVIAGQINSLKNILISRQSRM